MGKWKGMVVHHSESGDDAGLNTDDIRRYHIEENKWLDIGYHFLVEKVENGYECIAGRPLNMDGAHCKGCNSDHIGVCLVGNFMVSPPSAEQLATAAKYIRGLLVAFDIPKSSVFLHREKRDTNCPGDAFTKDLILDLL